LSDFVNKNKFKIDEPIQQYYKSTINTQEKITFKQLANHTAGLSRLPANLNLYTVDPNNPYKDYGKEEIEDFLTTHIKTNQAPGTKYEYSNLGTGLLAYLLAEYENTNYEALLKKYIFTKYEMLASTTDRALVKDQLVTGLNYQGDKAANWDFNVLVGAGGILSNVEDLSKFVIAQFNEKDEILKLTRQSTFSISDAMEIGLGWHIIKQEPTTALYWHNGGSGGYTSSMVLNLANKNAVVILSNVSAFNKDMGNIDKLSFEMMKLLK
jgi:CubicO group peptidase (beta-lactamase class C family)